MRLFDGPNAGPEVLQSLERTWSDPPGFIDALSAINHKTVAPRFVVTTLGPRFHETALDT
jgi:cytochrome c oxidase subunit I+III